MEATQRKAIVIDEKIKAQLKGIIPFTESATEKVIPEYYKEKNVPPELWPTFIVRPYTTEEAHKHRELWGVDGKMEQLFDLSENCIVNVENFIVQENGDFYNEKWNKDNRSFPTSVLTEVIKHIWKISFITEAEKISFQ